MFCEFFNAFEIVVHVFIGQVKFVEGKRVLYDIDAIVRKII
jgi:hypothetical protein